MRDCVRPFFPLCCVLDPATPWKFLSNIAGRVDWWRVYWRWGRHERQLRPSGERRRRPTSFKRLCCSWWLSVTRYDLQALCPALACCFQSLFTSGFKVTARWRRNQFLNSLSACCNALNYYGQCQPPFLLPAHCRLEGGPFRCTPPWILCPSPRSEVCCYKSLLYHCWTLWCLLADEMGSSDEEVERVPVLRPRRRNPRSVDSDDSQATRAVNSTEVGSVSSRDNCKGKAFSWPTRQ